LKSNRSQGIKKISETVVIQKLVVRLNFLVN
jgi:hypothetical protein